MCRSSASDHRHISDGEVPFVAVKNRCFLREPSGGGLVGHAVDPGRDYPPDVTRLLGGLLALLGLLMFLQDTLINRFPWIAERMPPGEPYGKHRTLHVFNRKAGGLFLCTMGLLLLAAG